MIFTEYESQSMWKSDGFLFQISEDHYLLGDGPFRLKKSPSGDDWNVFCAPFFLSSTESYWYQPIQVKHFSKSQLKSFLNPFFKKSFFSHLKWVEPDLKKFKEVFQMIQQKIRAQHIQKLVPVFFETSRDSISRNELPSFLYHFAFCLPGRAYAFWLGDQILIGSTPELLFKKNGLNVQTMALAGTTQTPSHNLLKDPKERWEHLLVVRGIKKSLKSLGELLISDTYIDGSTQISHLRTDFELNLKKDRSFNELCFLLHPTPALGGSPQSSAKALLYDLQNLCGFRHYFGAPFGVSFRNLSFCVVAIRNIQLINYKAYIGSGCGIVRDSQLEKEWKELKIKREFVKGI